MMASSEYDNVCRLCLVGADDGGIIPIFCENDDAETGGSSLADEIKACLSIQINEEDELPKLICKICLEKVKNWSTFKHVCDEAQTKLRDSMKQCHREEHVIDISFIKEEPITIGEEELLISEKNLTDFHQDDQVVAIKGEPKDIDEDSNTIQIESITSNYALPEILEVVPDIPDTCSAPDENYAGPPILASLGLAPKGTIMPKMLRNPVVNLTPLQFPDVYPMDTADSMDSADDNSVRSEKLPRKRKLLIKMTSCRICGLKFASNGNARRHEKSVHKFFGLQPNPLNPEIMLENAKSKSVMEPEILMEVDNESVFQSVGENSDGEQFESLSVSDRTTETPVDGTVLTEENLAYISKFKEILEQVHSRTCFCCNKSYGKLKALLSHLRKKYIVPPFQCFNCLINCATRGGYVQHIRQGQCRNLYSIYKRNPQDLLRYNTEAPRQTPASTKPKRNSAKMEKIPLKDALACKLFACNFCELKNRLKVVIKKHVNTEHQMEKAENMLQCSYCNKCFENSELKKRHSSNADCTSHVICELCGERFETLPPFNDHASSVHASVAVRKVPETYVTPSPVLNKISKGQITKCKYCPKTYSTYHNMLRHLKMHHNETNPYKCDSCKETFRFKTLLMAHQEKCLSGYTSQLDEEMQYNFSCKDCGVLFATLESWTKHQEVHQACEQCGATFQNIDELILHRKEHLKVKFYNCNVCGNSYSQAEQLSEHMLEHGVTEQNVLCKWFCEICEKPFENSFDYSTHMKIHNEMPVLTGQDGFEEDVIETKVKVNPKAGIVNGKSNARTGYHRCPLCNKHLVTKQGLYRHMLYRHKKHMAAAVENKQRIYRCDLCPKKYADARGVLRHKKTYHGYSRNMLQERPQPVIPVQQNMKPPQLEAKFCNQCGLSGFQSQLELNKHRLLSHYPRGAKVCNICNLITNDAKKMWYHKKKYHAIPGSSNQCNICRKLFVTKPQFYAHIKNAHLKLPMEIEVTASQKPVQRIKEQKLPPMTNNDMETGPWNCDLCPKVFNTVNALKSHRGWHLRTADGKSAAMTKLAPVWIPDQMSPSRAVKRIKVPSSVPGTSQDKYMMPKYKTIARNGAYCRLCNKSFSKIGIYKRHVMEVHRPKQTKRLDLNLEESEAMKRLHCKQCNETFQAKQEWIDHKIIHVVQFVKEKNLTQWPCIICGKMFSRKDNLKSHMKTHLHDVPESSKLNIINIPPKFFTCNPCRVTFTSEAELKAHTNSHGLNGNGAIPRVLKCDFCGFITDDVKEYQECRRMHHIPTKFKCDGCQIFFKTYGTLLKHHEEQHQNDGVEPPTSSTGYECNKCGKTYSMKRHLKRHMDSAH